MKRNHGFGVENHGEMYLHHVIQIVIGHKLRTHCIFCNKTVNVGSSVCLADLLLDSNWFIEAEETERKMKRQKYFLFLFFSTNTEAAKYNLR